MNLPLIAVLLTIIVAVIGFYPLLGKGKKKAQIQRDELNKALYFSRLKEIDEDDAQGLVENATTLKSELQKTLLEDIPQSQAPAVIEDKRYGKLWFIAGLLSLFIIGGLAYFPVGAWQAESMMDKTYQKLPYFLERMKEEDTKPMTEAEMEQFAVALRMDLQKDPKNAKNWWLLGQLGMNLGNGRLAYDSYQQAAKREPENLQYKLSYAKVLMYSEDPTDKAQGSDLLREVIRQDHTNFDALSLLAFRYFETEDYKMAAVTWAMMLRLIPADDERVPLIEKSIRAARDALALQEEEKARSITPEKAQQ